MGIYEGKRELNWDFFVEEITGKERVRWRVELSKQDCGEMMHSREGERNVCS